MIIPPTPPSSSLCTSESALSPDSATYEFRWDVEVPGPTELKHSGAVSGRYGQKFMKQWKRVLQAQKMAPLVSAKLSPRHARFQLCLAGEIEPPQVSVCEAEVSAELAHLRWTNGAAPEQNIEGEPADRHPAAGWQGVRVWVTFARHDVECVLGKKAKV